MLLSSARPNPIDNQSLNIGDSVVFGDGTFDSLSALSGVETEVVWGGPNDAVLDMFNGTLNGGGFVALSFGGRSLHDSSGNGVIDFSGDPILVYPDATFSGNVTANAFRAYAFAGTAFLNSDTGFGFDAYNGMLFENHTNPVIDLSGHLLTAGGLFSINWGTRQLLDDWESPAVDWQNRELWAEGGVGLPAMTWGDMVVINDLPNADTHVAFIDSEVLWNPNKTQTGFTQSGDAVNFVGHATASLSATLTEGAWQFALVDTGAAQSFQIRYRLPGGTYKSASIALT